MSGAADQLVTDGVIDIVREVLDHHELSPATPVGPDDDLYELGFDSLLIIQVAARVRERLGADPPLASYFDAGTVSELVEAVAAGTGPVGTGPAGTVPAGTGPAGTPPAAPAAAVEATP